MLVYEAGTTINAPIGRVWSLLTDAQRYPEWDNGVVRVEGLMADGQRIKVISEINPDRAFPVVVGDWQPPTRMTWTGGLPLGLFRGVRRFSLAGLDGATRFHMREEFTGPLLGFVSRSMPDLQPSFDAFVAGLKAEAQGSP